LYGIWLLYQRRPSLCLAPTHSKRLEAVRRRQVALKRQLDEEYGQLGTLEARVAEMDGVRRQEQARLKGLQSEVR
jgi:hypothetical protein